ncbi:MAG: 5'/3'-nucleotidase SurE [Chlamydiota bacterium]
MNSKNLPHVLLVNDDGIRASGLRSLYKALKGKVSLTVVAPLHQKSGSGLGTTLTKPLQIMSDTYFDGSTVYAVNGTPSDCVKLGLISLFPEKKPDFILSGINHGSNAGKTVLYSGTIGGVIEGMFRNEIPGIAFSSCDYDALSYEDFEPYIYPIFRYALEHPAPKGSFLNVNFPKKSTFPIQGIRLTKQGKGFWTDDHDRRIHPEGNPYYWLGGIWKDYEEDPESDVHALQQGFISVAPIHVEDLTDYEHHAQQQEAFNGYFGKERLGW